MHAAGDGLTGIALVKARDALSSVIEAEECGTDKRFHCEVVNLYHGGQFKLYRYREYSDVRLVFSPGDQAAFFGGDPDNYNFPRFDLDCAFLRLYDNGAPVVTPGHLRWNPAAPKLGDPTFVSGNPGTTFREFTLAELETQRDVSAPMGMTRLSELRGRLVAFGETGPDNHRVVAEALDELENDYKVYVRPLHGAQRSGLPGRARRRRGRPEGQGAGETGRRPRRSLGRHGEDPGRRTGALLPPPAWSPSTRRTRCCSTTPATSSVSPPSARSRPPSACRNMPTANCRPFASRSLDPRPIEPALERINLEFWFSKTREYLGVDDPAVAADAG